MAFDPAARAGGFMLPAGLASTGAALHDTTGLLADVGAAQAPHRMSR